MKVTAILDIGKTNKKFFLFDTKFREVYKNYTRFDEIKDEDGFPCDDIIAIKLWAKQQINKALKNDRYDLQAINFSTYGASLVHLDKKGKLVAPLYNYLKPIPKKISASFYEKYGSKSTIAAQTASPQLDMLNSGLQLYWLKYAKPEVFQKIRWSLHFPQYLSYLMTGVPLSEYTSIGCHTSLWDYAKKDYHDWVYAEQLDQILPPIVASDTSINVKRSGTVTKIGVGLHDSSAALIPYLKAADKAFLLISTGTWSICLHPFNHAILSQKELKHDCLNYMQTNGQSVKASRLFLGHEYQQQVEHLARHFGKDDDYHKSIKFDPKRYSKTRKLKRNQFHFESISLPRKQPKKTKLSTFKSYETAFHCLMKELCFMQIEAIERAIGKQKVESIYIDGGFADNKIYLQLLSQHFQGVNIFTTRSPLGSALGAAILVNQKTLDKQFLIKNYRLEKQKVKS